MWINTFFILCLNANLNNTFHIFKETFVYISPFIGIVSGYFIAKKSFNWQRDEQQKNEEKYITTLVRRSLDELSINESILKIMLEAFNQSEKPRAEHWEWLETIADSLQFDAIKRLLNNTPKESRLERAIGHIDLSFYEILACYHDVKQGYAEQRFLGSHKADSKKMNKTFEEIKINLSLTIESTENIVDIVSSELENVT